MAQERLSVRLSVNKLKSYGFREKGRIVEYQKVSGDGGWCLTVCIDLDNAVLGVYSR